MKLFQTVPAVKLHKPAAEIIGLFRYGGFVPVGLIPHKDSLGCFRSRQQLLQLRYSPEVMNRLYRLQYSLP
ncbi:hypothetical protein D3C80_1807520 [compost metagenome]